MPSDLISRLETLDAQLKRSTDEWSVREREREKLESRLKVAVVGLNDLPSDAEPEQRREAEQSLHRLQKQLAAAHQDASLARQVQLSIQKQRKDIRAQIDLAIADTGSGSAREAAPASQAGSFDSDALLSERAEPSRAPDVVRADSVAPRGAPVPAERVSSHSDDPATVDELARRPFAEVIAARIEEVAGIAGEARIRPIDALAVHLHGPWGAGKSSVLNFLRDHLQNPERPLEKRWVVVEFNAWQQQRLQPPWWTLIKEVYLQSTRQIGLVKAMALRVRWLAWRAYADWLPASAAVILILAAAYLGSGAIDQARTQGSAIAASGAATAAPPSPLEGVAKGLDTWLKVLLALLSAAGAVAAVSRTLVFGSGRAAQAYVDLKSDPLRPIVNLFGRLICAIERPVIVMIDDLDRCESKFVVDLLEGLQTLFRSAPVTYVVAADRKWITASFECKYADFSGAVGETGRPMGYLFLEKLFQISTSVPRLTSFLQSKYFERLLFGNLGNAASREATRKSKEADAMKAVEGSFTKEALEAKIGLAAGDIEGEQAIRAAAAKQITTPDALAVAEHRLQRFSAMLEQNPRSMKRLVNAYGMSQAVHFLEGRSVSPEALARWTILEQRWPILAEYLTGAPKKISEFSNIDAQVASSLPEALASLAGHEQIVAVLGSVERGDVGALNEASVRELTGQAAAQVTSFGSQA